jgi:hypothetical protein
MTTRKSTRKAGAAKKSGAKKAGARKAGAKKAGAGGAPMIFTSFSAGNFAALRAAKTSAAQRLMQPAQAMRAGATFSALSASTSPAPDTNLVGVGIGEKLSGGKHTGVMAVKFLVRIKYPENQIPSGEMLPKEVNGHPVDVEQVGTFRRFQPGAMPNPRRRMRPARPGCSIGFRAAGFIMAGTFGALVSRGTRRFILSNNHVIADENRLPIGAAIFQPGFLDAGNPPVTGRVANLSSFVPIVAGASNRVDAAIAQLTTPTIANNQTLFIGPPRGKTRALIDMVVHKFGRTTGFTVGRVTSIETDVNVEYDMGIVTFSDQILIRGLDAQPFSAGGDSGSLILERSTNKAVGLLFAGSSSHTIANHIDDVLQALGIRLVI